ncbi:ATP-binding protein [Gudongella oleilytica]|uniref:nucleotide-binding protein n=1 Tax=Gudongella oleilytica TaxID=1582259 RepID=UPI002A36AEBB|nr:ATP-binding protein [Gudongella oleilytica]MDY0256352.1 ATP-binding protein [Gudongella oleilytica]
MKNDKRIRIVIGHYGSGKTEFSVNYAVKLAKMGRKVGLVDLDVINPYFRSREKTALLAEIGIKVVGSNLEGNALDVPAISGEAATPLQDKSYDAILDVGGDPAGARALGRYFPILRDGEYDMFFVLNANRPETQSVEKAMEYIAKIEATARAKVTGIVNNTHMLKATSAEDVIRGYDLAVKVSEATGIPLRYNSCLESLADKLPDEVKTNVFPIQLYMREEWMI